MLWYFLPTAAAAAVALALSAFVLSANNRRPINHLWAAALLFISLWQASIVLAHWHVALPFIQWACIFGAGIAVAFGLVKETIMAPWKTVKGHLWSIRFQLLLLPLVLLVFTHWFLQPDRPHERRLGYWLINGAEFLWASGLVAHSIYLARRRDIPGMVRNELLAIIVLLGTILADVCITNFSRIVLKSPLGPQFASLSVIAGLGIFAWLAMRREVLDFRDLRKGFASWGVRSAACFAIGLACIFFISRAGETTGLQKLLYSSGLALVLLGFPLIGGWFDRMVNRRFASRGFIAAEAATSRLIERSQAGELYDGFVRVLRDWSDGSPEVFLSGAPFTTAWPPEVALTRILPLAAGKGWITPEILDRDGSSSQPARDAMIEHQMGALVCFTASSGDALTAVFGTRTSLRPFVTRELREARQLLQVMQLGLAVAKLRQKLRGNERLSLYAQYAPRFAHELRNSLYLQKQLLSAVAEGRWADVDPADAQAGLKGLAQVDRLCAHFFDAGSLFDRPVGRIDLGELLEETVKEMRAQFTDDAQAEIRLIASELHRAEVLANPELLRMAMANLVKNAVEAVAGSSGDRVISINATRLMDQVHLLVQDSGPGLPAERLQNPFQPGESTKRGGMGLGLSIARDCIEAMGGTIGVRLSGSAGACFEITLNAV